MACFEGLLSWESTVVGGQLEPLNWFFTFAWPLDLFVYSLTDVASASFFICGMRKAELHCRVQHRVRVLQTFHSLR
jgi:hypothetical protein